MVKRSKIITYQLKTMENPDIVDIKSVIIEHLKSLHKLSKTIRQAAKVSQVGTEKNSNSPLCSQTKKVKFFWVKKMQK